MMRLHLRLISIHLPDLSHATVFSPFDSCALFLAASISLLDSFTFVSLHSRFPFSFVLSWPPWSVSCLLVSKSIARWTNVVWLSRSIEARGEAAFKSSWRDCDCSWTIAKEDFLRKLRGFVRQWRVKREKEETARERNLRISVFDERMRMAVFVSFIFIFCFLYPDTLACHALSENNAGPGMTFAWRLMRRYILFAGRSFVPDRSIRRSGSKDARSQTITPAGWRAPST